MSEDINSTNPNGWLQAVCDSDNPDNEDSLLEEEWKEVSEEVSEELETYREEDWRFEDEPEPVEVPDTGNQQSAQQADPSADEQPQKGQDQKKKVIIIAMIIILVYAIYAIYFLHSSGGDNDEIVGWSNGSAAVSTETSEEAEEMSEEQFIVPQTEQSAEQTAEGSGSNLLMAMEESEPDAAVAPLKLNLEGVEDELFGLEWQIGVIEEDILVLQRQMEAGGEANFYHDYWNFIASMPLILGELFLLADHDEQIKMLEEENQNFQSQFAALEDDLERRGYEELTRTDQGLNELSERIRMVENGRLSLASLEDTTQISREIQALSTSFTNELARLSENMAKETLASQEQIQSLTQTLESLRSEVETLAATLPTASADPEKPAADPAAEPPANEPTEEPANVNMAEYFRENIPERLHPYYERFFDSPKDGPDCDTLRDQDEDVATILYCYAFERWRRCHTAGRRHCLVHLDWAEQMDID